MDIVNKFLVNTYKIRCTSGGYMFQEIRPQIICNDGTFLSVQASDGHYCQPRENKAWPYSLVEVGYPSIRPPRIWQQYFDGEWYPDNIFGILDRLWRDRSKIWWSFKTGLKDHRWRSFKYYTSFRDNATASVYGYIPTKLVVQFIDSHGGIDEVKTYKPKEETK
jgi:hypothetical protein